MKVRSYGKLADLLGSERDLKIDEPCTIAELRAHLAVQFPDAAASLNNRRVRACVDGSVVPDSYVVDPGDQIELLAPVSGG